MVDVTCVSPSPAFASVVQLSPIERMCTVIFVAGYGVPGGPTNGQPMKGNGTNPVFLLRKHTHTYNHHTHTATATLFDVNVLYVTGYGAQAGGYGGQATKGNGIIDDF